MAKKRRIATDSSTALENNPLAGLGALMGTVPDAEVVEAEPAREPADPRSGDAIVSGKLLVRREKKGRGGKTVTVIEGLAAGLPELEDLARQMKKDFGCGAHVEGPNVVLQAAQPERARTWLLERGAKKVIVGN